MTNLSASWSRKMGPTACLFPQQNTHLFFLQLSHSYNFGHMCELEPPQAHGSTWQTESENPAVVGITSYRIDANNVAALKKGCKGLWYCKTAWRTGRNSCSKICPRPFHDKPSGKWMYSMNYKRTAKWSANWGGNLKWGLDKDQEKKLQKEKKNK